MLMVEDCLNRLDRIVDGQVQDSLGNPIHIAHEWDRRFISDVAGFVHKNQALSTAQGDTVLKFVNRYFEELVASGLPRSDLDILVKHPQYRTPPYHSAKVPREVRWVGDNQLVFRFKFNSSIQDDIKKLKGNNFIIDHCHSKYNGQHKLWVVFVNSGNWQRVMDFIKQYKFEFDDAVAQYFMEVSNSAGQISLVRVEDDAIEVDVRDDDFLNAWVNMMNVLER